MKLHVLTEQLQKKLSLVSKITSVKTQLPVLQNILLQTKEGKLVISATDLEIGMQMEIPANIEKEGTITIPARQFTELISSLPNEKITLEVKEKTLIVTSKKTKSSFQTISADEFPKLYEEKGEELVSVEQSTLQQILSRVLFAASIDTSRPALGGIFLKQEEGNFFIVATDGYRLSLVKSSLKITLTKPLLITARVLREVALLKSEQKGAIIKIFVSEKSNQVLFEQEDTILVGRLIEAQFPDYEKIIPQEATTKVSFDRQDLEKAVKMAAIFARESANIIRFSIQKESITVSANAPQTGENSIEVEARLSGDENEIAFNAKYLLDVFANIKEEEMVLSMTSSTSPGVFTVKGDSGFLHLIMPIRVQTE